MWLRDITEFLFSMGLFLNAALFVPQAIQLYRTKETDGVSLLTFGGFCVLQILAVLHGYLHKDYILMIGYFLSILTCGTVTLLILLYKE